MKLKEFKDREARRKFLKEIGVIAIGTAVGVVTYLICLITHFDIFGWNFGLILSPLFAGYAESFLAKRYLEESTGAVSAFILFIITVVWGFIISNPTLGFNIITAGSIIIIIQAAIPTATNYFLIGMTLAIISHISGIFKKITDFFYKIYLQLMGKLNLEPHIIREENAEEKYHFYESEPDMNHLGVLLLTLEYLPQGKELIENKGVYEIREMFSFNQREELKSMRKNEMHIKLMASVKQTETKALYKLIKELKNDGCNAVLNFHMTFETLGSDKGENVRQIIVRGTRVVLEDKNDC